MQILPITPKPCALCLQHKDLRQSHIVPEFMYQEMYDPKHRFQTLSRVVSDKPRQHQKGLREDLLCSDCETLLSKVESYAAQVFYQSGAPSTRVDGRMIILGGIDYPKMKLFLLSLLWRFAVTSLKEFQGASLGRHSELLRQMLLKQDPGDELKYPCLMTAVTWQGNHLGDFIAPPSLARTEGHHVWSFVVAGIVMSFYVSSHATTALPKEAFLTKAGSMIISTSEITDIPYLHQFVSEITDAGRARKNQSTPSQS